MVRDNDVCPRFRRLLWRFEMVIVGGWLDGFGPRR
jgi:hypothetical protein